MNENPIWVCAADAVFDINEMLCAVKESGYVRVIFKNSTWVNATPIRASAIGKYIGNCEFDARNAARIAGGRFGFRRIPRHSQ